MNLPVSFFDVLLLFLSVKKRIFILTGTFRMNLDPYGRYSDDDLWRVAEEVKIPFAKIMTASIIDKQTCSG